MADDLTVIDLVARAKTGEQQAWDELVERYAPLIWSICRRFRLEAADAEDVGQVVWLRLVTCLDDLRDPAALPGWLVTTTQRECVRARRAAGTRPESGYVLATEDLPDIGIAAVEEELLRAERNATLRDALTRLPPGCQQLLTLLMTDPPIPYAEISARLGIPTGSIGPSRRRCLDKLGRDPAIIALLSSETARV